MDFVIKMIITNLKARTLNKVPMKYMSSSSRKDCNSALGLLGVLGLASYLQVGQQYYTLLS
jgi:hypothetical protein